MIRRHSPPVSTVGTGCSHGCSTPRHRRIQAITSDVQPAPAPLAGTRSLKILLAEDTPTNQRVVATILAKRNHSVDVAGNGLEVLERVKCRQYDLILMDVQMPQMNGFEAASSVRKLESATGRRTPIVALTAHTVDEEWQRCQRAEMDAFLAKPIDARQLVELVERFAERSRVRHGVWEEQPSGGDLPKPGRPRETFDAEAALRRLGGNRALLHSMSQAFCEEATTLVAQLRRGLVEANGEQVHRAAHSLGGLAAAFDARAAVEAARSIEQSSRSGDLELAAAAAVDLEIQIQRLREALTNHLAIPG